ncbi:L,D-transpeptidase family protein [Ponticaulis sp.]|uniref:L,D-transpeptidase family protein n=1 Tax=Ponticaulis sp. TaxID=2020902 RepID=UPI000C6A0CCE|nr:L,D-transpeptidase family protein [Ponticaulis sp.]MAF58659.1 hypothetical protein [Ponticaulis sp.]MBN06019.1 hypothetical protein [Ponticaulis sp.]
MKVFREYTTALKAGVSAAAVMLAVTPAAFANHHNDTAQTSVESPVHEANLQIEVDSRMAGAVQDLFIQEDFAELFGADVTEGELMLARSAYAQRLFEPVWTYDGVDGLLEAVASVGRYGVVMSDEDRQRISILADRRFTGGDAADRARADILLTAEWFDLMARIGGPLENMGEATASQTNAPARSELVVLLERSGQGDVRSSAEHVAPQAAQFQMLQAELERYQMIEARGGWIAIPDADDALEPGMTDARVPALRERMIAEGYYSAGDLLERTTEFFAQNDAVEAETVSVTTETTLTEDADSDLEAEAEAEAPDFNEWYITYDETLADAVEAFQEQHGLEIDGVLGPNTLEALNESVDSKVDRIRAAMDFWREQGDMGERFVWANVPSFTAEGWANNQREISMRAIFGLPSRATPIFSDEIEYAVANPRWYAPVSIVSRDKIPHMQEDPSYAARNGYTIVDRETGSTVAAETVDWYADNAGSRYQFIQAPGDNNALGELKIIFPNQHSVYLHGTPSVHLFDRAQRAFSSGCVRLENPVDMAMWVAGDDFESMEDLQEALDDSELRRVDFENHVPVHITYVTVTVAEDGHARFWRDVYNRENSIRMEERVAPLWEPQDEPAAEIAQMSPVAAGSL